MLANDARENVPHVGDADDPDCVLALLIRSVVPGIPDRRHAPCGLALFQLVAKVDDADAHGSGRLFERGCDVDHTRRNISRETDPLFLGQLSAFDAPAVERVRTIAVAGQIFSDYMVHLSKAPPGAVFAGR